MTSIQRINIEYNQRGPVETVEYRIVVKLANPNVLTGLIEHILKFAQAHLLINQVYKYKLGLIISTSKIAGFSVCFSKIHNPHIITNRFLRHAQSKREVLGRNLIITFKIKALMVNQLRRRNV